MLSRSSTCHAYMQYQEVPWFSLRGGSLFKTDRSAGYV